MFLSFFFFFFNQAAENPIISNNPITFPSDSAAQIQGWICGLARFTDRLLKKGKQQCRISWPPALFRDLESEGDMIIERWDNDREREIERGEKEEKNGLWTVDHS